MTSIIILAIPVLLHWTNPLFTIGGESFKDHKGSIVYEHVGDEYIKVAENFNDANYSVFDMLPDEHCYVVTAYNSEGGESDHLEEVCKEATWWQFFKKIHNIYLKRKE